MSIQNVQAGTQGVERYIIRAKTESQKAEELHQAQESQELQEVDQYDKANPVGEEAEGIYSVSHDTEGNLKIDYKQPSQKENASNVQTVKASPSPAVSSTEDTSSDDDELEELKQQRDTIRQQLNRESDEGIKAQLRVQLQSIETQIALKSSGNIDG